MIHERDAQDSLGIAEKQGSQLIQDFGVAEIPGNFTNIVYSGMGGSSLSALLSQTWPGYDMPFTVCRDYDIPSYINAQTLFIACSYSGNTEETLSTLDQAEKTDATIIVMTGGGKLAEVAREIGHPLVILPKFAQPRFAALSILRALCEVLTQANIIGPDKLKDLEAAADHVNKSVASWRTDVPTSNNPAKQLALELMGSSIVVYSSTLFASVAYKWKISFNENAKTVAWWNQYPEFNHNEFLGWTSHPVDKPYKVIDLRSSFNHPRIQKRFEISDRMLSGKRPMAHVVDFQGSTILEQMLWGVAFGDFVALYLALLNGLNPTPVDLIEKFKSELAT